jgi:hypothetical protein
VLYCQQVSGLYVWYAEGTDLTTGHRSTAEDIERNLDATVKRLGGTLERVEHYEEWRYAPHASAEAVRDGVLHTLKRKQGEDGLTFLLAAASFETTARSMQNARDVVRRMIPIILTRHSDRRHDGASRSNSLRSARSV